MDNAWTTRAMKTKLKTERKRSALWNHDRPDDPLKPLRKEIGPLADYPPRSSKSGGMWCFQRSMAVPEQWEIPVFM